MKKFYLLNVLLFFINTNAQSVKGSVFDEYNKPLYGANVYLDGSSIATITDQNGNFTLPILTKINLPIIISFVGFETQYFKNNDVNTFMKIILKEKINHLNDVVIHKSKYTRKQMIKLFKEQFLGVTNAAKETIIENEDAINFFYNEKTLVFEASSNEALIIKNPYFGYKITYQLVNFEIKFPFLSILSPDVINSYYAGLSRFEELNVNEKIIKRRIKNYQGSSAHFFRSLLKNDLTTNKFVLYDGSFATETKNCFKINDTLDLKKITVIKNPKSFKPKNFIAEYSILFNKKEQSKIIFYTDYFYIDSFGNFSNLESIIFSGDFAKKRVANMLPINFGIK